MEPGRPLFLKTYGKQRRKLSAWISPDNRKQVFDSSGSTAGDDSVFEPVKPKKRREKTTRVTSRRGARVAKTKATACLKEKTVDELSSDIIMVPSSPEVPQRSKTTRRRKPSRASSKLPPAKRKAVSPLTENGSDEENVDWAQPPCPVPPQTGSNATRRSRITSAQALSTQQKGKQVPGTSGSEGDSRAPLRSVGRFVTRRRRNAPAKLQEVIASILDSSGDFTPGALRSRGGRRRTRRKTIPAAPLPWSTENSSNASGTFCIKPLRELSLNESADGGLAPHPSKLIFCSTPSAGTLGKRPCLENVPVGEKSSPPPPLSASGAGVLSPLQGNEVSLEQALSANSEDKLRETYRRGELSANLFEEHVTTTRRNRGQLEARGRSTYSKMEKSADLSRLKTLHSDNSLEFLSADGGLEWLVEALKVQCLTRVCTVALERADVLAATQLCGQTTYSSCLGLSALAGSLETEECPTSSVALLTSPSVSVSKNETIGHSPSACVLRSDVSERSQESALDYEGTHDTESGDCIMDTHLTTNSSVNTPASVTSKCSVRLERLSLGTEEQEPSLICIYSSVSPGTHNTDESGGEEELMHSGEPTDPAERQTLSSDPETEGRAALVATLKEKCLSGNVSVKIQRLTLSQLRDNECKLPLVGSELLFDQQIQTELEYGRDHQPRREDPSPKARGKNCNSTSSEDKTSPDKEVSKRSRDVRSKRGKASLAPREGKRRSVSADRPGTTRKACVSGLSVNRWKTKNGSYSTRVHGGDGGARSVDCSINELITARHQQPRELGSVMKFSTPVRGSPLNISSLLAHFTPSKHTWSRLKAALSVHRKVLLTPRSAHLLRTPVRTNLTDLSQDLFSTPFRTLLPKHLRSQCFGESPGFPEEADLSDAEKVYAECGQKQPLPWEECILPQRMKRCAKIGEGTFGEVFSTTNASGDTVALKIIPVEGSERVNGEAQKTFGEILHEIIISKELSSLKEKKENQTHSFIGLNDLHCVRGRYPPDFMNAWDKFDQQKGSENDRPDFFDSDQLFLILEFEFGGADLENSNGKLASLGVAKSILHQVTAAMAVAEQELRFEHRDLHWGNILVKTTKQKTGSFLLNGTPHSLETAGVLVRIIDYSLSRLEIDDLTVSCDISNDEELFMGQGDYQFEIYRMMRRENGNNWSDFHPHSNVLWLHYLCSKLLAMKYRGQGGRSAKDTRAELTRFHDNILQYGSATDVLQNCPMFQ